MADDRTTPAARTPFYLVRSRESFRSTTAGVDLSCLARTPFYLTRSRESSRSTPAVVDLSTQTLAPKPLAATIRRRASAPPADAPRPLSALGSIDLSSVEGPSRRPAAKADSVAPKTNRGISDAALAVLDRIMDAMVTRVRACGLSGIASTKVVREWLPTYLSSHSPALPMLVVSPVNGETFPGTRAGHDDTGYTIGIALIERKNGDDSAGRSRRILWREKIDRAMREERLPGVLWMHQEPGRPVVDAQAFGDGNFTSSWMRFRVIVRESGGLPFVAPTPPVVSSGTPIGLLLTLTGGGGIPVPPVVSSGTPSGLLLTLTR